MGVVDEEPGRGAGGSGKEHRLRRAPKPDGDHGEPGEGDGADPGCEAIESVDQVEGVDDDHHEGHRQRQRQPPEVDHLAPAQAQPIDLEARGEGRQGDGNLAGELRRRRELHRVVDHSQRQSEEAADQQSGQQPAGSLLPGP